MADQAVRPSSDAVEPAPAGVRWRTVDIVVTAVLGVAFGVVFWAWNLLLGGCRRRFDCFPPGAGDPLRRLADARPSWPPLLVRKPGAAAVRRDCSPRPSQPAARLAVGPDHRRLRPGRRASAASWASLLTRYRRFGWAQAVLAGGHRRAVASMLDLTSTTRCPGLSVLGLQADLHRCSP